MRRLNHVNFILLLVLTLGLGACGDDVYYTDDFLRNSDEKLCSARAWSESYITDENMKCVHQLKFTIDKRGQEVFNYYRTGESRPARVETFNFSWEWIDQTMEGLRLDRGAGEILYFDNVWVRENYLSGSLDGVQVTFVKEK